MSGKVTLLGAGPGDPGMLTLRGRAALEQAEVVVYDRLVSPEILALIPPGAERIDAGKAASRHTMEQTEIDSLLLSLALAGRRVVRLKGGDPFLFGRGGEELRLLAERGVPFEVIPGVSSALAVPAYAGIPVTHRALASSLHILTGHRRGDGPLELDYEALARLGGTLVFLMGLATLEELFAGLRGAGMPPQTPAAAIERGTTPRQRTVRGTLETLPGLVRAEALESPALLVVGEVCALGEAYNWFERLPLFGRTVAVTRPEERAAELTEGLRALGAEVLPFPCIAIRPLPPSPEQEAALDALGRYEWLALTSPAGVETLFAALDRRGADVRALGPLSLAAVGEGTAAALWKRGLRADLVPEVYDTEHLGQALGRRAKGRVLLWRSEDASPRLPEALRRAGIAFDEVAAYRTETVAPPNEALRRLKAAKGPVYVTFTSASTVRGFARAVGPAPQVRGICIGAQSAEAAHRFGYRVETAEKATVASVIQAVLRAAERGE